MKKKITIKMCAIYIFYKEIKSMNERIVVK